MSLTLSGVTLYAGGRVLLDRLSLDVAPGCAVTLMGPSGIGKSSLLAWIAGTVPEGGPQGGEGLRGQGSVALDGRDITQLAPHRRGIGILYQDDVLFPHMSVAGNLLFGLPASVRGRAARQHAVDAALAQVDLAGFGPRDPATLSGGQRTRAILARMLLSRPRALLLDEPFSGLDAALRAALRAWLARLLREQALPSILVTHDPSDAIGTVLDFPASIAGSASAPPSGR